MKKAMLIAVLAGLMTIPAFAAHIGDQTLDQVARARLPFIENCGQYGADVRFAVKTLAGSVHVDKQGHLVYALPFASQQGGKPGGYNVLREEFVEASSAAVAGTEPAATRASFFQGRNTSGWRSNVPAYRSIVWKSLYPGIDLSVRACGNTIEKVFTLAPGSEPEDILITVAGADKLLVDETGRLVVRTSKGDAIFSAPVAYQPGQRGSDPVAIQYRVDGNRYGFEISDYDLSRPLIIDPLLGGTYLGGYRWDDAFALTVDSEGRVYVAGATTSTDFPVTPGSYQTTKAGTDAFISLFDNRLTNLIASTFLGGTGVQSAYAITLDSFGRVYIAGDTTSTNFPTTEGAYQRVHQSGETNDVFVSIMDGNLSTLIASTLLVGDEMEWPDTIAVDGFNNVYVAGVTRSTNFPVTAGAFQRDLKGWGDGFVSKLDSTLGSLLGSTYIGGSNYDRVLSLQLDLCSDIFISGITGGNGFPTTNLPYSSVFGGGEHDGFVSKLDAGLSNLLFSTYIGGSENDWPNELAVTASGIYIAGNSFSSNFPTTAGAYQPLLAGGTNDAIVAAFDTGLHNLLYSTFIGGADYDSIEAMTPGADGSLWLAGYTFSHNFPTTPNAYCRTNRSSDVFVTRINSQLSTLGASTLVGGTWDDYGYAIDLDSQGNVFVTGYTEAWDFPTSPRAYERSYHTPNNPGWGDAFVIKMDSSLDASPAPPVFISASDKTYPDRVAVTWEESAAALSYSIWRNTENISAGATPLVNLTETTLTYYDWSALPGTQYYYWGRASNAVGPSAFSDAAAGMRSPGFPLAADLDGDAKADPIVVASGQWYAWLSTANYMKVGPAIGSSPAWPAAAFDMDNDRKADPTAMNLEGRLFCWFSSSGYQLIVSAMFGSGNASLLLADFDGDGLGDPTVVDLNTWYIWMSSAGYQPSQPLDYGNYTMIPLAADFDGDRIADFARYWSGEWYVYLSSAYYSGFGPFAYGAEGDLPVAADFDGDRLADMAVYNPTSGNWYVWLSSANYFRVGPFPFHP
ncbi:MAG: SBBP repeat-containing protein [Kiritimatiellia bacterium]